MEIALSILVGRNIRKYRKKMGLSQEELAEKSGLHRTYIGGIERGERNITLDSLQVIADALSVEPVLLIIKDDSDVQ